MEDTQHNFYSLFSPVSTAEIERMCSLATESCCATSLFCQEQTQSTKRVCPCQNGLEETLHDPRNAEVTELQLSEISDDVGTCWREVGPKLHISAAKIHNLDDEYRSNRDKANALLILWKQQEGKEATVGSLADVLESIGRKGIVEKRLGLRTSGPNCNSQWSRRVDSEESNEAHKIKEFKEIRGKMVSLEAKVSKMSSRIIELEEKNRELRARLALKDTVAERREHPVEQTNQATREFTIRCELQYINNWLYTQVTFPLEVSEVKQDQFDKVVKIDLLTKVTRSLQDLYSAMQAIVGEAYKCGEDTKTEYFDLAYYGLRAAHNDLTQRINDLERTQELMSEEEKEKFQRLQTCHVNRQIQMEILENLWESLFNSLVDDLTGNKSRGGKKVRRDAFSGDVYRRRSYGQRSSLNK